MFWLHQNLLLFTLPTSTLPQPPLPTSPIPPFLSYPCLLPSHPTCPPQPSATTPIPSHPHPLSSLPCNPIPTPSLVPKPFPLQHLRGDKKFDSKV